MATLTGTLTADGEAVSPPELKHADLSNGDAAANLQEKYAQERKKRLRPDGASQFVDLYDHPKFAHFKQDPWVGDTIPPADLPSPKDGARSEILVIGGGYGGLLFAVRLLQAGFKLEDIRMVDCAGGFGGTWYWNRYPGLTCDIESYIYMPLLEETGYVPTQKYTTGKELREHAERIAKHWGLDKVAWFRQRVDSIEWDDKSKEWVTGLKPQLGRGNEGSLISVRSRFLMLTTGVVLVPRVPRIPGIERFKGACFHTARWDYDSTGGTADKPDLVKLKGQRVGIIGTGATAIQVVPALKDWAEKLYVFQRTPSAVDRRDNRPTDPKWAEEIRSKPGWQYERIENFQAFVTNAAKKPHVDLVDDGWTKMLSHSALGGCPDLECRTLEDIQKHVEELHVIDLPRQESIRRRVDEIVTNPNTAEKLKPWYPGWCKRACFHDEYLQSFNKPNVELVDTNGFGVNEITEDGVVVGNNEYKIDTLILCTGYKSPVLFSPAGRVGLDVKGRNGLSLDKKWNQGVTTLHGMMSHDFPNLFWPGLNQSAASPNFIYPIDIAATHVAGTMARAVHSSSPSNSQGPSYRYNFIIEPTATGEEEWSQVIVSGAGSFAASAGCTPSYFNAEGEMDRDVPPEVMQKRARSAVWSKGPSHLRRFLADWRAAEKLEGLEISPVP
ncbi:hypothetical protein NM208_g7783 [Fusarium decemcellulare]|uniref:Uncharacterized protein n=1 Tax=Fusarium decemcellulare TaxID=57161 RepID=A0ACC1S7W4_9HYPO|nr:hypothetical protein NM208_g7783 [Fusarium decemcellulare]